MSSTRSPPLKCDATHGVSTALSERPGPNVGAGWPSSTRTAADRICWASSESIENRPIGDSSPIRRYHLCDPGRKGMAPLPAEITLGAARIADQSGSLARRLHGAYVLAPVQPD